MKVKYLIVIVIALVISFLFYYKICEYRALQTLVSTYDKNILNELIVIEELNTLYMEADVNTGANSSSQSPTDKTATESNENASPTSKKTLRYYKIVKDKEIQYSDVLNTDKKGLENLNKKVKYLFG